MKFYSDLDNVRVNGATVIIPQNAEIVCGTKVIELVKEIVTWKPMYLVSFTRRAKEEQRYSLRALRNMPYLRVA
jgi:hypothetical protein